MNSPGMIYEQPRNLTLAAYLPSADMLADDDGFEGPGCSPMLLFWTGGAAMLNLLLTCYLVFCFL